MAGSRRISVKRKYNEEYYQIHIDLSKDNNPIKIFFKSGRDSTDNRIELHSALKDSLRLGLNDCKIEKQCILEGELLVWDSHWMQIEPFYKIRKHVRRSGRSLNTAQDSPVNPNKHLIIIFYDILLLDDIVYATELYDKRRYRLRSVMQYIPGRAKIGTRMKIRFLLRYASELLRYEFTRAIIAYWEGLVLKGYNNLYFAFSGTHQHIKLKKDYITGLKDTADFAIIGERRDIKYKQELQIEKLT
jgi:DNA ligase 4